MNIVFIDKTIIDSLVVQLQKISSPTGNRPGAIQASKTNLHHSSPYCLQLLSGVTARVSRLMVATQQVKGKT
jgi:hypothetical protein